MMTYLGDNNNRDSLASLPTLTLSATVIFGRAGPHSLSRIGNMQCLEAPR